MREAIIITDIETGGFSKEKNGICEIAFLAVDAETFEVIDSYSNLIAPYERDVSIQEEPNQLVSYKEDAMNVNRILVEDLTTFGISPEEFCFESIEFLSKFSIVAFMGHNIDKFDRPWLDYFYSRFSDEVLDLSNTIDTLSIAREKITGSHKLVDLCTLFEIKSNESHRALSDCYDCLNVYKNLV